MTQHTPGPWNVTGLYVRERNGGLIASILDLWHGQKTPKAEMDANARLISVAPDLLAALRGAIETADGTAGMSEAWWYAPARVAIAKATQGQ